MRGIRTAIGATTINPTLLTSAERLRYQGYVRRPDAGDSPESDPNNDPTEVENATIGFET
jgi:hypothetical protein